MTETAALLDVENDGEIVVLLDGRRFLVEPGDMPTACTWSPTASILLGSSRDRVFNVSMTNEASGETIIAMAAPGK